MELKPLSASLHPLHRVPKSREMDSKDWMRVEIHGRTKGMQTEMKSTGPQIL